MAHTMPFPRGTTFHGAAGTIDTSALSCPSMEGMEVETPALDSSGDPIAGKTVKGLIVRSWSDTALKAGQAVKWRTAFRGRQVDSTAVGLYGEVAGIVDDQLGYTVRKGDLFLLIRGGQSRHLTHTTAAVASVGDKMYASATAGTLLSIASEESSSGDQFDVDELLSLAHNLVGIAIDAVATTANDSSLRAIDLKIVT